MIVGYFIAKKYSKKSIWKTDIDQTFTRLRLNLIWLFARDRLWPPCQSEK